MAKLNLGLQTEQYQRTERDEYGTIRSIVQEFKTEHNVKNAKCVPVNAYNFANKGKQMILQIVEVNDKKKPENLKRSNSFRVGKELSAEVRSGLTKFSQLADMPVIHHVHQEPDAEGNPIEYPLVVRPARDAGEIPADFASFEITEETDTTDYQREVPSIAGILANMQV